MARAEHDVKPRYMRQVQKVSLGAMLTRGSHHDRQVVHAHGCDLLNRKSCSIRGPVAAEIGIDHLKLHRQSCSQPIGQTGLRMGWLCIVQ